MHATSQRCGEHSIKEGKERDARKVLDDPVRIRLDPKVEQQQYEPSDPAQDVEQDRVTGRAGPGQEREREEDVGEKVV